jgi:hypothetical protein
MLSTSRETLRIVLTFVHGFHFTPAPLKESKRYLSARNPAVASQWHPTRNGVVTPETVTSG